MICAVRVSKECGFQALMGRGHRVWMPCLNLWRMMTLLRQKKAGVAMIPASHLATLPLLARDLFLGCHTSLFPFILFLAHFSSHLFLRFWRSQWEKESQKRERLWGKKLCVCHRCSHSADSPSRFIWLGLLLEEMSDTTLGICTLHRRPADGKGPGSSSGVRRE